MMNNESNKKTSDGHLRGQSIFLALFSGILIFLSFPKFGLGFIAWIAFVPLFMALRNVISLWKALLLGWIAGMTACVGILYWIAYVVVNYGHLPMYLGVTLMLLLACYLSLYYALFAAGIVYLRRRFPLYVVAPVLWICLEYGKSYLFTGFPWENLGYSQFNNIIFIQIADVAGVFGLSFLIILLNVTFFEIMKERSKKSFALAATVFLLWSGVYGYGIWRINQIDKALKGSPVMAVSLIQGNIDQSIKWNKNFQKETIRIYEELSLRPPSAEGRLIVWPETAVPFNFQEQNDLYDQITELSIKSRSWLIFGSMSYEKTGHENTDYFNSAYLLSPQGNVQGKYDKVHLVPYGEYVPMRKLFPFVSSLAAGISDFAEGKGFYPLTMGDRKIGVLICYEAILPEAARMYKNKAAELLVNITNDAWFGTTSAPYQHLSMAVFRAIETRLYLVRAANTGISTIVDPTGKILVQTEIFKKDRIDGNIKFIALPTFYARYGDLLVGASMICLIVFFLWSLKGRKKNVSRKYAGRH
ncbi:MAG: apolipoprotein N-acyltransferase [Deltaproteobacteria bacterium]